MNRRLLVRWAYAVEVIAAALFIVPFLLFFGPVGVANFIRAFSTDMATLVCAGVLAASLAFLWTFYSKSDSEFYRWLDERGHFEVYLKATGYTVLVSFASTVSMLLIKVIPGSTLPLFAAFLLVLTAINLYTLVQNVFGLMRLNNKFNQAHHRDG